MPLCTTQRLHRLIQACCCLLAVVLWVGHRPHAEDCHGHPHPDQKHETCTLCAIGGGTALAAELPVGPDTPALTPVGIGRPCDADSPRRILHAAPGMPRSPPVLN